MTTIIEVSMAPASQQRAEQRLWLALAGALLATLVALPFLPESVAADTGARVFLLLLLLVAAIDALTLKVPNALILPAIVFALASTLVVDASLLPAALAGGAAAFGVMFVLAVVQRGAMGMGDVKAACFSGCVLGMKGGVFSLLFGFTAAGAIALPLILLRLRGRKDTLPLAPFLVIGALVSYYFWGFLLPGSF